MCNNTRLGVTVGQTSQASEPIASFELPASARREQSLSGREKPSSERSQVASGYPASAAFSIAKAWQLAVNKRPSGSLIAASDRIFESRASLLLAGKADHVSLICRGNLPIARGLVRSDYFPVCVEQHLRACVTKFTRCARRVVYCR